MLESQALQVVRQYLAQFAATDDFESSIEMIFGIRIGGAAIRQQWLSEDFSLIPELRVLANGELGTANGAYAADLDEILVSADFLGRHQDDVAAVAGLLLEEIGHKIDRVLNGNVDSPGDEGAIFRLLATGQSLSPEMLVGLRAQNDRSVILLDGKGVEIEKQDFFGDAGGIVTNDNIVGTAGDDNISGLGGNDTLNGGDGNDRLFGGNGNDTLNGDAGNDDLNSDAGSDNINGGAGTDTYSANYSDRLSGLTMTYDSVTGNGTIVVGLETDTLTSIEGLSNFFTGTNFDDTLVGSANRDFAMRGGAGNDSISGNGGDDYLLGDDGNDTVNGGDGNDDLFGGNGNDTLNGDAGNDSLNSDAGSDNINGGAGTDSYSANYSDRLSGLTMTFDSVTGNGTVVVGTETDTLNSIENLSSFTGTNFDDTLVGTASRDFAMRGGAGNDSISGNGGDDYLLGDDGNDTVTGGDGNDDLFGGNGNDTLNGDVGNDSLNSDAGSDNINGGAGTDSYSANYSDRTSGLTMTFDSATGNGTVVVGTETDALTSIENLSSFIGTNFDDTIVGTASRDFAMRGGAGNDTISANGGDDYLLGDDGNDTVNGGDGDDDLFGGNGNDTLNGDAGNDSLNSDAGSDNINGGAGTDTYRADYSDRLSGLTMTFDSVTGNGTVVVGTETDTLTSIENLSSFTGTNFDDTLVGSASRDFAMRGGAGNDSISGNGEDDYLLGDDGNDTINGGDGSDNLFGGNGNDTLNGDAGNDSLNSDAGDDAINGGAGTDTYRADYSDRLSGLTMTFDSVTGNGTVVVGTETDTLTSIENLSSFTGTNFDDTLVGSANRDFAMRGGAGNDTISGNGEDDYLLGDDGNDTINGGDGSDNLFGGNGNDTLNGANSNSLNPGTGERDNLTGGAGVDRFILGDAANIYYDDRNVTTAGTNDHATITDFNPSEDKVQLQGVASNYLLVVSGTNTNLYVDKAGTEPDELIGIFQNVTGLSLTSSAFEYVAPVSQVAFSAGTFSAVENGAAQVTVVRTGSTVGSISVTLALANGTATAPADYNNAAISVTFNNGESSKVIMIPVVDDTIFEPNETINLSLTNPSTGVSLGTQNTAVFTIVDNDSAVPGTITFSGSNYSVNENGSPVVAITLVRNGGSDGAVAATVNLADGTANAPSDYNNAPITVDFADKETSKTIVIPIVNDTTYELNETVNLTLVNPTGGATLGTQKTAALTILDDDAVPGVLAFSQGNYSVNENGTAVVAVTITRMGGSNGAVSTTVSLTDGTATAPSDYGNNSIVVSFADGDTTSKTVTIPIVNDTLIEGNETVNLTLTNPTDGATLGTQKSAVLTIVDDDLVNLIPGVLSFANPTYSLNESGETVGTVTINRTGGSDGAISTTILLNGGTATAGSDYNSNPITVNFASGETSKTVTIPIANDTLVEPTETFNLTLTNPTGGASIDSTKNTAIVSILDDDVQLSFSGANYSVNENGTAISNITVTRSGRSTGAVSATLSFTDGTAKGCVCAASSVNNDFYNGTFVVDFADGETSKVIPVQLASLSGTNAIRIRDDAKVEGDEFFTISLINPTGGATIGSQSSANVTIIDNDPLPVLSVSFNQNAIAENAGVNAATGTVTRNVATDAPLIVTLASSDTTEAKVPQQVTIAAGQTSATFAIDAVDDTILDGTQTVTITATPLNADTNLPLTAGIATKALLVTDNESPSLTLTVDREIVAETGTALATITRNTDTTNNLVVTIASSDTTEATVPQTVTILAGQTAANFTVSGVNDGITDGSQPVVITASASGFAVAAKAINVTDIDVPDLFITQLNPAVPTYTGAQATFNYRLENKGIIAATAPDKPNLNPVEKDPWIDRVYLSTDNILDSTDKLLGEFPFTGSITTGSFYERNITYFAPQTPGQYYLIGVTDATNKVNEGVGESNNTVITPITVTPAYKATVATDVTIANIGTKVLLKGQASSTKDNSPVAFEFVKIKVENKGVIRELDAFTDVNGNFTKDFQPLAGEGGTYSINAYFPSNPVEDTASEDTFKLVGMRFEQDNQLLPSVTQKIVQGTTYTGSVKLQNLSDVALSGLTGSAIGAPSNWTVNITPQKSTLAGDEEIAVNYSITVPDGSIRRDDLKLRLTSAEGITTDLPVTINVDPIVPKLVASTNIINSGMLRGSQTFVEVEVTNNGGDIAKNIMVLLPDAPWLALTSPTMIPTLAPGASTKVTIRLNPDANLPLTEYKGNLILDVEGNDGDLTVPFNFRAVSSAVGEVRINISDELTYFAEGAPKLKGATVNLLDYFSKEVIGTAVSDDTGFVDFSNIKEGNYSLEVKADKHSTFEQTIQLSAGEIENVDAFLSRQTVQYIWTVTPTEIQDKYNIAVESIFETNVPVPTLVIEPSSLDFTDLTTIGQVKQVDMTVTNHGLIAANNIALNISNHPFYKVEPLLDNFGTIGAKSSLTIPVKITRIADFNTLNSSSVGELQTSSSPSIPCGLTYGLIYDFPCGGRDVKLALPLPVIGLVGNCGGFGGFPFGGFGFGGGGTISVPSITLPSCNPCIQDLIQAAIKCAIKFIDLTPVQKCAFDAYKCLAGGANLGKDTSISDAADVAYNCSKTVINCAVALGKISPIGKYIKVIECEVDFIKAILKCAKDLQSNSLNSLSLSEVDGKNADLATSIVSTATVKQFQADFARLNKVIDAQTQLFGDVVWLKASDSEGFASWFAAFDSRSNGTTLADRKISVAERNELLNLPLPSAITATDVNKFLDRWNRSLDNWSVGNRNLSDIPTGESTDFIAIDVWTDKLALANTAFDESKLAGYIDPGQQILTDIEELKKSLESGKGNNGACATVRLRIDQDAVMTRSAFIGELEIDNGNATSLTNLSVNIQVKDANGNVVNDLFGIDNPILKNISAVNGTGVLTGDDPNTPQDEGVGSAKWTFIPTNLAAPAAPTQYTIGGTLAYIEDGKAISVPLFSTSITVYPQAELYLNYFHQRDVFGDDPFTPQTETSVPYQLGVLVENKGKGAAKNLSITSGQPKIVDNEKGLLVDFDIIGSQVNGKDISPSLTVDFGNIGAGQTAVADWLLKSSLQGKFIDYKATFEHVNSLGKKELSLIKDVQIHELTHQVKVNHANPDNLPDFLVNDVFDANFYPDTLYFSSGGTAAVKTVATATTDGNASSTDLEIQVTAAVDKGYSFIRLADPGDGQFKVKKVLRADGTEVDLANIWTTDRTFPAVGRPVYENILNLFDYNATAGNAKYTVLYASGDNSAPKVKQIVDIDSNPRNTPTTSLDVVFTKAIQTNTFDFNDFTLTRDGGANLITSAVTVNQISPTTYRINNLTGITGNVGQYQLSVNASGINDIEGLAGVGTVTDSWVVNGDKPAVLKLEGIAANRRNTPVDTVTVTFTEALNPTSFDLSDILLSRNNSSNLVNADVSITQINPTTYQINGLTNLTKVDGDYQILIQANGVKDLDGNNGIGGKGFNWTLGGTAPVVTDIVNLQTNPRNTAVSSLDVKLSGAIDLTTFTSDDITLTLNGGANLITSGVTVAAVDNTTYRINGLNGITTADGNYKLTVNGSGIKDTFGNAGTGTQSETWLMDSIAPTAPTNLLVGGSNAIAGQFRTNSTNPTVNGELGETGLQVFFYDKVAGNNLGQATVTGKTFTGTVPLPASGTQNLELRVQDAAGNTTSTPLNLFSNTVKPSIVDFPSLANSSVNPIDSIDVSFSAPINLSTFTKDDLTLTRDGVVLTLPSTVTVDFVSGTTYRVKGLQGLTTPLGNYQLKVDATTLQDNTGNSGDAPKTATFSIVAPPTPGITLTQTNGNTSVTEGGNTDTYSLILKTQPTANVTVNLALDKQITTDKTSLTFTPTNWNIAQTVTVKAVDDSIAQGSRTVNITQTVTSTDTNYSALTIPNLPINITDNDAEIRGLKWNDVNGNGIKDTTETGLKDWNIYLDTNTNGQLDTGEISTTTDANGNYSFTNLRPGTYTVAEQLQPGWKQTYPGVSVTTTSSAIQLINPSSPIVTSDTFSTTSATNLVNLNQLWTDPRFSSIKGKGYSTVIIDTGADLNSSYFGADADNNGIADKIVYQYDFADNDTDASDKNNHGSHVASIASAVAPDANLIILKVFKDSGTGSFADLEKALQWVNTNATAYNIVSVNLSLGDGQDWTTPISRYGIGDELASIAAQSVLISAAAGNGFYTYNSQVGLAYPAIDPSVISVGAVWADNFGSRSFTNGAIDNTTAPDRIASFSQRSPLLDVFAPGILITGANSTGGSITMGGTSQATPFVSGIATLAQQIAQINLGRKLSLTEFDTLLSTTSDLIIDGDDENDNVTNTGATYPRINVLSLANGILKLGGTGTTTTPTSPTNNGTQTSLNLPVTNLNLAHTVTVVGGDVKTDINFGNQQIAQRPRNDFDGDGKSDILWRNNDGSVATWQMDGGTAKPSSIEKPTSDWQIAGTGDFNGDGKADMLWRNTDSSISTWQMNGSAVTKASFVGTAQTDWQVVGTGDFDGDGKSDLVFQHTDGRIAQWQMNGSTVVTATPIVGTPTPDWQVAGTGDFNGDGKSDLLLINKDGTIAAWQMNGMTVTAASIIGAVTPDWKIAGIGDANGDGKADIFFRNTNGSVAEWQMNGSTVTATATVGSATSDWNITGTSDFNGDGNADILWRNDNGGVATWQLNGANVLSAGLTSIPTADLAWKIAAPIL
jgi:Ca2+-binding RTX toxin-like protein